MARLSHRLHPDRLRRRWPARGAVAATHRLERWGFDQMGQRN